jgi:hypothetical protein
MTTENMQQETQIPLPDVTGPSDVQEVQDVQQEEIYTESPDITQEDTSVQTEGTNVQTDSGTPPVENVPSQPQYNPEQLQKMQQEAAQYEQVQMRAALQSEADKYKENLENQGFLPEHADHAANYYVQSQQQQMNLMRQAEQYGQHIQGMQIAAENFANKYNLGIKDLGILRQASSPQEMENTAKKLSEDRARDNELAQLRQSKVPAQNFDNSQGNPQVAANEGSWLDRYNGGDRSPSAVAAAKRAAGLG